MDGLTVTFRVWLPVNVHVGVFSGLAAQLGASTKKKLPLKVLSVSWTGALAGALTATICVWGALPAAAVKVREVGAALSVVTGAVTFKVRGTVTVDPPDWNTSDPV